MDHAGVGRHALVISRPGGLPFAFSGGRLDRSTKLEAVSVPLPYKPMATDVVFLELRGFGTCGGFNVAVVEWQADCSSADVKCGQIKADSRTNVK
jgi:hypothetical protein